MPATETVVIGAGQAGLAMSSCLTDRAVEHIVLERGRVAQRWRSERWDSMRLLSPNWMTRLPGWSYTGPDPDGFMTAAEVAGYFEGYAAASAAPVEEDTTVLRLTAEDGRFAVETDRGAWAAANVVIATGWCDRPAIPAAARSLASSTHQIVPSTYRNPHHLPEGGVLVVGASATGVQLAAELAARGRDVVVAVGRHTRLPRAYRGMDILWWLERVGQFDHTIDEITDVHWARHQPSLQLAGLPGGRSLDLTSLQRACVRIVGRITGIDGRRVRLADDVATTAAAADARLRRVLDDVDRHIAANGLGSEVLDPDRPRPFRPDPGTSTRLDLGREGINTVMWATGHRRAYPWLQVPVLDAAGEIAQRRGVTSCPGLYVLGQRFQHFRSSDFIDGVGRDAVGVADHLVARAARRAALR
jgi:putative flavoprotein involved in K+ transport